MAKKLTDKVIESFYEGNHKAFEIIYRKYFPKIKYYIKGFVKSTSVAEELTQNVFLKVWESHDVFEISCPKGVDSYIYTIAYRQTIDYIRSKQVRDSFYNDQKKLSADLIDIEEEYIAMETMLLIEMEIEKMPEKQRTIFKMSRKDGIPNKKIAEQLDISKRTVENQLSLAMKRIKSILSFLL